MIRLGQAVSYDLRKAAFDRMSELPVEYFDTHPAGDLISRICYDVDTVNATISTDLLQIATSCLTVVGSFVMLLVLSPLLAGVFMVTVPLSVLLTRYQMKRIHPLFRQRSRMLGALNGFAEERIDRQRAIRIYGVEAADLEQFRSKNDAASQAYYQADRTSASLGPSVNFINNLSLAAISVFGALLYLGGRLSLGSLSSFVLYSRKFSGPIREAANLLSELQASAAAAERVLDLLDEKLEPADGPDAKSADALRGEICFDHVTFGYDPARPVLRDFCARIPAGTLVAVVGPTGAGKTTLVSLLLRFYHPQSGCITIDGVPVEAYSRDGLRRRLTRHARLGQNPHLVVALLTVADQRARTAHLRRGVRRAVRRKRAKVAAHRRIRAINALTAELHRAVFRLRRSRAQQVRLRHVHDKLNLRGVIRRQRVLRAGNNRPAPVLHRGEAVHAALLRADVEPLEVQKNMLHIKCPPSYSARPSARRSRPRSGGSCGSCQTAPAAARWIPSRRPSCSPRPSARARPAPCRG